MKIAIQYLCDSSGKSSAVQLPLTDWQKILEKLKKYEQTLKIKADLTQGFDEVTILKKSKERKQTLAEFLNKL
jgi:hypothetical protein